MEIVLSPKKIMKKVLVHLKKTLTPNQKRLLKKCLTAKQIDLIKKTVNPKPNTMKKKIMRQKKLFLNNGFKERGYSDFMQMVEDDSKPKLQKLAAWELTIWHGNQYTKEDAQKCLELIEIAMKDENGQKRSSQAAVMRAECHQILGNIEQAIEIIEQAIDKCGANPDLCLAASNLQSSDSKKIEWINKALGAYEVASVEFNYATMNPSFDSLKSNVIRDEQDFEATEMPKVTVIMPVYNSELVIETALDSVLSQTWKNLEVLVVDDCSSDATGDIIRKYEEKDSRVQLIMAEQNGGAYAARNLALRVATGEFVTCHDADDWSHPEKIEKQVLHLIKRPKVMGNTSQQARATDDLKFYRRGNPGFYIFNNMSSFMFRRQLVMEAIGFWDCVRFGADSEFIRRIKKVFGEKAIVNMNTGPLSFQRQSEGSLTASDAFGYHGYFMGARKEYFETYNLYHDQLESLKYEFPQSKRPFPIPEPMKPNREAKPSEQRHFDVIIASDFRLDGGSNLSNLEEIKAHKQLGLRTGLIQMSRYDYNAWKKVNPKIREAQDDNNVQMLVYGEKVSCDVLIVRYPPVLQEWQTYIPEVEAKEVKVIINQTPMSDYGSEGVLRFDFPTCQQNAIKYFGKEPTWYPIGPLVRETLYQHHGQELSSISLADEDWVNIINVEEWKREQRPMNNGKIRIGRHSRDNKVKWPAEREEMLSVYPDSDEFEIHVLGGAESPKEVLGKLPRNWTVYEFGELTPKEFLSNLDVFVYYTHPDWVESFGRVIIEAMAVGVPVIIPHQFRELFGEAAIYAEKNEVKEKIQDLMNNASYYESQVITAFDFIEKKFGYSMHNTRIIKDESVKILNNI